MFNESPSNLGMLLYGAMSLSNPFHPLCNIILPNFYPKVKKILVLSNIDKISSPIKKNVLGVLFCGFSIGFLTLKNSPLFRNDNYRVGT